MFKSKSKHPKFKKRGIKDSFSLREKQKFHVEDRDLRIEKLKTLIKMRQQVRFEGECKQCTISKKAGKWFASILIKLKTNPFTHKVPSENQVGIDLGIKEMAVLSNGEVFPANQQLKKKLKKLAKLQRRLARKVKGSNRFRILKLKIQKLYYYISCKRKAIIHEFTDYITKTFKRIVIEDLKVSKMLENKQLARSLSDVSFHEMRRQLEYKSKWRNCELIIANQWFPSSKLCSNCGNKKKDLHLSDRIYRCDKCKFEIDRDLNASINLLNYIPNWSKSELKCA